MEIKELIQKYKPIIILSIIIVILTSLNLYMLWLLNKDEVKEEAQIVETKETEETKSKLVKVDIKGEIVHPGLYEVTEESRVMDIIDKAGGLTENADTSVINLSKKVKDEMVILVYSKAEVEKLKEKAETTITCPEVNDACITDEATTPLIEEDQTNSQTTNGKISINKATIEELQTLNGIGEAKAKAIIEYRLKEGEFKTIEDITKVDGIGEALFEKIKDNITT